MEQPRQTLPTADAFLAWAAEQAGGRYDLDGGLVVAMALALDPPGIEVATSAFFASP